MDSEVTDLAGIKSVTVSTLQVKPSEGTFADGDKTKLDGIEASADVTDATNVAAAGAVMTTGNQTVAGTKTFSSTISGSVDGNAATATKLANARTIGGVSFDGSANIDLPGVNAAGNQNTTGSAATLTTARTIGGVSFDGSANIDLPGVNATGNQNTTGNAATATILATARTIGGVSFDGSANIDLPGVNALEIKILQECCNADYCKNYWWSKF